MPLPQGSRLPSSPSDSDLPKSTEQVLHAEKYFASEEPVKVELPDIAPLLGKRWKLTDRDVNGEWGYYLLLDEFLNAKGDSQKASAGWGGDRYALYEGADKGEVLVAQLSVWDTENDAIEFFDAYTRRTTLRYKSGNRLTSLKDNTVFSMSTGEGAVLIERRGARVAILEGVPPKVDGRKLMERVWQQTAPAE